MCVHVYVYITSNCRIKGNKIVMLININIYIYIIFESI